MRTRPVPFTLAASIARSTLTLTTFALLSTLVTGCGGATPEPSDDPTPTASPQQDARGQLAGRAAAAKDHRFVATYRLQTKGQTDRTVTVAVATDGSWVVAIPGGLLGGLVDAAIFHSAEGLFQCWTGLSSMAVTATPGSVAPGSLPNAPGCVKVTRLAVKADPRLQHVFTDWIDSLIDREAALSVVTTGALPGAAGACYSIESNSAGLAPPIDPGIYCYELNGTLTGARTKIGNLTLIGTPADAPPSITMPAPAVARAPLTTAAPPPPPPPTSSASTSPSP